VLETVDSTAELADPIAEVVETPIRVGGEIIKS
jgi:hypothetical protein